MDPDEEYISFLSTKERSKFLKQRKQYLENNKWYEADKILQKETLPGTEYLPMTNSISRIVRNNNLINTLNLNDSDKKDIINQINNLKDQGDRLFT